MMIIKKTGRDSAGFTNLELLLLTIVVIILGALVAVSSSAVLQKSRDTERKDDITALQEQLNEYQAENNQYPTAAELNDSAFIKSNLKTFQQKILQDPVWRATNIHCAAGGRPQLEATTTPDKGCYGYAVSPAACDDKNVDCTSYTLTARLESGSIYTKKSVD